MHDPCHVIFDIKYPWYSQKPWSKKLQDKIKSGTLSYEQARRNIPKNMPHPEGQRNSFITIWHRDPETDGSDCSCYNAHRSLTSEQKNGIHALSWGEARNPYFLRSNSKTYTGSRSEAESLYRGLILQICEYTHVSMSYDEAAKRAALRIHGADCIDGADIFCYIPGYHTNNQEDDREDRERYFYEMCSGILQSIIAERQPWYKHQKWHIWHWRLQVHPWENFVRRWFDKCEQCGTKFGSTENVYSTCWERPRKTWKDALMFWRGNTHLQCIKCNSNAISS